MQRRFPKTQSLGVAPAAATGFDWNDLKYFLAVARQGGLSRAALELDTSASTVSRHIGALEKRLDMRLFVRLPSGYLLTDAGSELFERVAEVERSTQAVERGSSVAGETDQVSGLVRLAAGDSVGAHLVAPRLGLLRQSHPGLRVELVLSHAPADLSRREADLALRVMDEPDAGQLQDHIAHRVGSLRFGLYAARTLLQDARPERVDWRRLPHVGWDLAWAHLPVAQWLSQAYAKRPPAFSSNSMAAQLAAVHAGLGVGALPHYLAQGDAVLVRLAADERLPERGLWLIYHRDLRSSRRVQALRDFIDTVLPPALAAAAA